MPELAIIQETEQGQPTVADVDPLTLLKEIEGVLACSRVQYRDAMLKAGRLLQRYIVVKMKARIWHWENRGECKCDRMKVRTYRARVVEEAAKSLRIESRKIWELVKVSACVDLLSDPDKVTDGGMVGELSYTALRCFYKCVRRKSDRDISWIEREEWEIKGQPRIDVRQVFRDAVRENWEYRVISQRLSPVRGVHGPSTGCKGTKGKVKGKSYHSPASLSGTGGTMHQPKSMLYIAKNSHPKDIADMVRELVANCPQADTLKTLIREYLSL